MDKAFLAAYSLRLIETCHRRGAFAMGGMAAQHPGQGRRGGERRPRSTRSAPTRSARRRNGHDGTWVAHPGLVPVALEAFAAMTARTSSTARSTAASPATTCCALHDGPRTEAGRAREYPRRRPIYRRLARRARRGAALQSDGGCGDRRDLPHPALAMAAGSKRRSTTAGTLTRPLFDASARGGDGGAVRKASGSKRRAASSNRSSLPTSLDGSS